MTRLEALKQAHPEWCFRCGASAWEDGLPAGHRCLCVHFTRTGFAAALVSALQESESENAALKLAPSVENCRAERAMGNGGCGACALCCQELKQVYESESAAAKQASEVAEGELRALRRLLEKRTEALEVASHVIGRLKGKPTVNRIINEALALTVEQFMEEK